VRKWRSPEARRLAHDRTADGDTLALSARQLLRQTIEIVREVEHACGIVDTALLFRLRQLCHAQREGDVLRDSEMRIERVGLEHHRQSTLAGRGVSRIDAVYLDGATGDVLKPGYQSQQGGFATA